MKSRTSSGGYTIVEALIFLGVSAALLVSTLTVVSSQQNRTQFTQATQDIRSKLDDIANDIGNGYYKNTNDFSCVASQVSPFPSPTISASASNAQGANEGCIFLGRAIQFSPSNQPGNYNVHTIVGRQYSGTNLSSSVVVSLAEAKPVSTVPFATETSQLEHGLTFAWMEYVDSAGTAQRGSVTGVGFFSNLAAYSYVSDSLNSASQTTSVVPVVGTVADSPTTFGDSIENVPVTAGITGTNRPVRICFNSGGSNQHAILGLATDGGRLTSDITVGAGSCP